MPPAVIDEESALHHVDPPSTTAAASAAHINNLHSSPVTSVSIAAPSTSQQHPGIVTTPSLDESLRKSHIRASITSASSASKKANQKPPPRLIHPLLHNVPMHIRFGLNGFLSNVLFMIAYNAAVVQFEHLASSSTIYATVYLIFIPISHAIISLLVFGWPERYVRSLMSNAPVGLTAIVLGASLTAYLDRVEFNEWVAEAMTQYVKYFSRWIPSSMQYLPTETTAPTIPSLENEPPDKTVLAGGGSGEFYSSIFVLLVTGIWTFALSVFVNNPAEPLEKKEL